MKIESGMISDEASKAYLDARTSLLGSRAAIAAAMNVMLGEPVSGAVFEDGGVSLIRHGTEDSRCLQRGSKRLYTLNNGEKQA